MCKLLYWFIMDKKLKCKVGLCNIFIWNYKLVVIIYVFEFFRVVFEGKFWDSFKIFFCMFKERMRFLVNNDEIIN